MDFLNVGVIIDGQPNCTINNTSIIMPTEPVSLSCEVMLHGVTSQNMNLTSNGIVIASGNSSRVSWRGPASTVMNNGSVLCILSNQITCACPSAKGDETVTVRSRDESLAYCRYE